MRTRLLTAALAVAITLVTHRSEAQSAGIPDSAYLVMDRLLRQRQELSLTDLQVQELAALSDRLREGRGRLRIVNFDRVPGKSVPRFERVQPTGEQARRSALRYLTREQRRPAMALLDALGRTDTAQS